MRLLLTLAALALATIAIYARVAAFDFVQADDTDLIRGNISFLQDLRNVGETFERSYFETAGQPGGRKTYYRPLVVVSFMLDAQAAGAAPRRYHVTNVVFHVAAVLLLFLLLRALDAGDAPSFLSALLFAVHPVNVQAVAWIPGRNDTLMAVFGLAALIALVRYTTTKTGGWLALHVTAFAAALFTKEAALALPVLFVLFVHLWPAPGDRRRHVRALLMVDIPVAAVWLALRQAALAAPSSGALDGQLLWTAVRNAPHLLVYAGKMVFPVHLSVMPGLTWIDATLGVAAIALLAWMLASLSPARRWLILAWLSLFLVPALLIPGLPAYEHRLYFPLVSVMTGLAWVPVWRGGHRRRAAAIATAVVVSVAFGVMTAAHARVFRDRYAYWSSATTGTPWAGIAHVNLGQICESDGDLERAAEHYRAALAVDPATPGAHNNLGVLAARAGKLDSAKIEFEREIERNPANADAYFNLGLTYKLSDRLDEAAPWWERAVAVDPAHAAAHEELAAYFEAKGDAARAARHRNAMSPR